MLYPMRIYQAVRENLPAFHDFFGTYLLPVQLRHGARLVGGWETEDGRVVAIWEYNDAPAYEQIQAAVRAVSTALGRRPQSRGSATRRVALSAQRKRPCR